MAQFGLSGCSVRQHLFRGQVGFQRANVVIQANTLSRGNVRRDVRRARHATRSASRDENGFGNNRPQDSDWWPWMLERERLERSFAASSSSEALMNLSYEQMSDTGPLSWMWPSPSPARGSLSGVDHSQQEAVPAWTSASPDPIESISKTDDIYVILFGVGESEMEGIYSLRATSPDGLPVDTVVAFADETGAQRYATLLEATMDYTPQVCPIPWSEVEEFCRASGYCCRLEPGDSLLIPPEKNVCVTDWERSLRLRQGEYEVLGEVMSSPSSELPEYEFDLEAARGMLERLYCSAA